MVFFAAGPPQGSAPPAKRTPSGMSPDTQQSIADCCVPGESERHTSRKVERKPMAQRGGFFDTLQPSTGLAGVSSVNR